MSIDDQDIGYQKEYMTIKKIIQSHHFSASKKLGQNFLIDPNIPHVIVDAAKITSADTVIEVGPGPGALSQHIIHSPAKKISFIEKDRQFLDHLNYLCSKNINSSLYIEDALKIDWAAYPPFKLISNLPYNIGTELLLKWLSLPIIPTMIIMLQKEVGDRLIAKPKTKDYGRLSILTQWLCSVEKICDVPPSCFWPAPKVTSTVLKLTPFSKPLFKASIDQLEKLTHAVFQQRRKMIRNGLSLLIPDKLEEKLTEINLKPTLRPEELSIEDFCRLSQVIE